MHQGYNMEPIPDQIAKLEEKCAGYNFKSMRFMSKLGKRKFCPAGLVDFASVARRVAQLQNDLPMENSALPCAEFILATRLLDFLYGR